MYPNIILGAIGGLCWSIIGTIREKTKEDPEDFSSLKFAKSIIIGGIIGGYLGYSGQMVDTSTIEAFTASSGLYLTLTAVVDKVVGIVWNLFNKVR